MKLLFLDFDGVLNSREFCKRVRQPSIIGLDRLAILRVNEIIRRTDCKIVVSSVHRYGKTVPELQRRLSRLGLKSKTVIGKTPEFKDGGERGLEIQSWIDNEWIEWISRYGAETLEAICILDDDSDMAHLKHRLVQTSFDDGLQDTHVERVVEMLNAKMTDIRQLAEDLAVAREDLNDCIQDFEDAMFEKRGKSAMVRMKSGTLSWNGEQLFVITDRDKKPLLKCTVEIRLEATGMFKELLQKAGLTA